MGKYSEIRKILSTNLGEYNTFTCLQLGAIYTVPVFPEPIMERFCHFTAKVSFDVLMIVSVHFRAKKNSADLELAISLVFLCVILSFKNEKKNTFYIRRPTKVYSD